MTTNNDVRAGKAIIGEMTPEEHELIEEAQRALVKVIEKGARRRYVLPMIGIATANLFAEICAQVQDVPHLVDTVNFQLERAGCRLVPIRN